MTISSNSITFILCRKLTLWTRKRGCLSQHAGERGTVHNCKPLTMLVFYQNDFPSHMGRKMHTNCYSSHIPEICTLICFVQSEREKIAQLPKPDFENYETRPRQFNINHKNWKKKCKFCVGRAGKGMELKIAILITFFIQNAGTTIFAVYFPLRFYNSQSSFNDSFSFQYILFNNILPKNGGDVALENKILQVHIKGKSWSYMFLSII